MTSTNGQDQSTSALREQERIALERPQSPAPPGLRQFLLREASPEPERTQSSIRHNRDTLTAETNQFQPRYRSLIGRDTTSSISQQRAGYLTHQRPGYLSNFAGRESTKPSGLTEGFAKICDRWRVNQDERIKLLHLEDEPGFAELILSGQIPPFTGDLKDRMGLIIGISLGLGDLFDDSVHAERSWLTKLHPALGTVSPMEHMLTGEMAALHAVTSLVKDARGIR